MFDLLTSDQSTFAALDIISQPGIITSAVWTTMLFLIWSIAWKAVALWIAARNNSKPWYIAILATNTLGILEILYIFHFGKNKESVDVLSSEKKTPEKILEEAKKETISKEELL